MYCLDSDREPYFRNSNCVLQLPDCCQAVISIDLGSYPQYFEILRERITIRGQPICDVMLICILKCNNRSTLIEIVVELKFIRRSKREEIDRLINEITLKLKTCEDILRQVSQYLYRLDSTVKILIVPNEIVHSVVKIAGNRRLGFVISRYVSYLSEGKELCITDKNTFVNHICLILCRGKTWEV